MNALALNSIHLSYTLWLVTAIMLWAGFTEAQTVLDSGTTLRERIEVHEQSGDYEAMVRTALDLRDNAETTEDRVDAMRTIGRAYMLAGDREKSLDTLEAAARLVDASVSQDSLAQLYIDTAGILGDIGQHERALEVAEQGIESVGDGVAPELRGELEVMRGASLIELDRLDEAMEAYELAGEYPLEVRLRLLLRNNVAMIDKFRGEFDQALTGFTDMLEDAERHEQPRAIVYALLELGDINRQLGKYDTARNYLNEALAHSMESGRRPWQFFSHSYLAELESEIRDEAAAKQHQNRVAELQASMQTQTAEDRAKVLQMTMEVMERDNQINLLEVEQELQAVRLDRSRKLFWLVGLAAILLVIALWLALKQVRLRALANLKLDQLANTDTLTGLYNRRYLLHQAKTILALPESEVANVSLILIDLDHFKLVNDQNGHDYGDAVLVETARRLGKVMRNGEALARWGGEEFLALLPNCGLAEAVKIAKRMREAIMALPVVYEGVSLNVTATLGVAEIGSDRTLDPAFRQADKALYEGKSTGRNRVMIAKLDKITEVAS